MLEGASEPIRHVIPAAGIARQILGAPSVRVDRRTIEGEMEQDRAFGRALQAMVGIDRVQPIVFRGKHLGWARGRPGSRDVEYRRRTARDPMWCAFASYDNIIAAYGLGKRWNLSLNKVHTTAPVANNYYDLWPVAGDPQAGAYGGAAFTAVVKNDTTTGAAWGGGNVSTDVKNLLYGWVNSSAGTPTFYLYDRCLTYEACAFNANANQVFTNTATLTRYQNAGDGACKILATCQTALGATAANITQLRYSDQDGNTLQTMPTGTAVAHIVSAAAPTANLGARIVAPATAAATLPWGPYVPLAVGDGGARLINDWTTSAANTGTLCFILGRPLAVLPTQTAGVTSLYDLVEQVAGLEKIVDGACLSLMMYFPAATASTINGGALVGWG